MELDPVPEIRVFGASLDFVKRIILERVEAENARRRFGNRAA
jgi:hypothetical protein